MHSLMDYIHCRVWGEYLWGGRGFGWGGMEVNWRGSDAIYILYMYTVTLW